MTSGPIKLTDSTGVRFEGEASPAPGGGSMPGIKPVTLDVAWNTPNILKADGGVHFYTPTVGDYLCGACLLLPNTVFNGTSPAISWGQPASGAISRFDATTGPLVTGGYVINDHFIELADAIVSMPLMGQGNSDPALFAFDTTPIVVWLGDDADEDPGSTEGEGTIVLYVIPTPVTF